VIFEWDSGKATSNLRDHRVAFEEAATVFLDPLAVTYPDPDHSDREEREITIGYFCQAASPVCVSLPERRSSEDHQRTEGDPKGAQTA